MYLPKSTNCARYIQIILFTCTCELKLMHDASFQKYKKYMPQIKTRLTQLHLLRLHKGNSSIIFLYWLKFDVPDIHISLHFIMTSKCKQ